ncbi:putative RuvC [Pseudomonas phage OBP]|uniref:putative RuvC n=1 Tax=Pseudomonas phage OBP TaxID=1124849 RepID=UPI000240D55E|nr:putative RuvC [Pseudomonas phage OBP]AEV89574.1 putative RuvC [Pseudomonas phage OBP]
MSVRILGIDPGISNLGAAGFEVDCYERKPFKLIYADTLQGDYNDFGISKTNPLQIKALGLTRAYGTVFEIVEPHAVSCEDNFLGPSPSSFKRLIEIVSFIHLHNANTGDRVGFIQVLPRLAKQIVNADFRGTTKDDVTKGLKACPFIDLNGFDLDKLTEHANDAILLGLYSCVQYYKELGWDVFDGKN